MNEDVVAPEMALARRVYALFNARDVQRIQEFLAEGVEWDWSRSLGPDVGLRHGRAAVLRFFATHWEHWQEIEMLPVSLTEVQGTVVVDLKVRLRGRDGIEVTVRGGHVQAWSEDGLLTKYVLFQSLDEALAAARAGI